MNKSMTLRELTEKIKKIDNILIIAHINPDPDTIGSALGLKYIFEKLNKTAYIACDSKVNARVCAYFDISREIDSTEVERSGFKPDHIICVDAAAAHLIGKYADIFKDNIDIVIDHHYTNDFYAKETYLDIKAAATGEIIFDIAKELNIEIDKTFARNIYCAIVDDSGAFRYSSTTAKTMRAAAELISTGFDFAKLNRLIFQNKSMTQIKIERLAYNSLKFYCGGRLAFITITKEMKKESGLEGVEIDGINNITVSVEGVEAGITITEIGSGEFKISLRSNDYVNVAEIAERFGGGGHIRAAGCTYKGDADELEQKLIEMIEKVL